MVLDNLGRRQLGKSFTKKQKSDWLDEFADWHLLTKQLHDELKPLLAALVLEVGRQALIALGADPADFDAAEATVAAYPEDRSLKVATAINDETKKQLRAELGQGIDADESGPELAARIEKVFGAALTYRSARIASTEIVGAQGFGDVAAWKQSGLVSAKEWYTSEDELVCPFCLSLDGTITSLDEYFLRNGDTITAGGERMTVSFGDLHTPPLHNNCRCYLLEIRIAPEGLLQ